MLAETSLKMHVAVVSFFRLFTANVRFVDINKVFEQSIIHYSNVHSLVMLYIIVLLNVY